MDRSIIDYPSMDGEIVRTAKEEFRIMKNYWKIAALLAGTGLLYGCGSAYSGLANTSGLGAGQYQPAVFVEPGNEARYQQILPICRQVAANRQATAAQKAQLETITGTVASAASGAAAGLEFGNILGAGGFKTDALKSAGIGAAAGVLSGLASSFASGAEDTAKETRRILLNCLKETSRGGTFWKVLE